MLAYVFWHWPKPGIEDSSYRNLLRNFHQILAARAPRGFLRSVAFAVSHLPVQSTSHPGFEDWYLVEDSAALDIINHAAVSGACEEPHNHVAGYAAGGTAGLYRLHSGSENLAAARYATWLNKPEGRSYPDFYSDLKPVTSQPGFGLWQRQMTLGPTTEFAIYSLTKSDETSQTTELDVVWPGR